MTIKQPVDNVEELQIALQSTSSLEEKIDILDSFKGVSQFLDYSPLKEVAIQLSKEELFLLKSILAIGQGELLFGKIDSKLLNVSSLSDLLRSLLPIEQFYAPIGGIVGYHLTALKLLNQQNKPSSLPHRYHYPEGTDIEEENPETRQAILLGLKALPQIAEIYPVGGAGDRLNCIDETGEPAPVAQLPFLGHTLLEGLIQDLQAKEYLYYKLFGSN